MDESPGGTTPGTPGSAIPAPAMPEVGEPAEQPAPPAALPALPPPPPAQPPPPPGTGRATGEPMPAGNPPAGFMYAATAPAPAPGDASGRPAPSPVASRWGGPVLAVLLAAAILLAGSLAVALVVVPPKVEGGPGSPAATVTAYAAAITSGRYGEAYDLLGTRARSGMTLEEFKSMGTGFEFGDQQLTILGVTEIGTRATVRANLSMSFGPETTIEPVEIDLVNVDGRWIIETPMFGLMPEPEYPESEF